MTKTDTACNCNGAPRIEPKQMLVVCRDCGGVRPASTTAPTRTLTQSPNEPRPLSIWPGERIR